MPVLRYGSAVRLRYNAMAMPDVSTPRRLQFHLSTAIVTMLAAGTLITVNSIRQTFRYQFASNYALEVSTRGWPFFGEVSVVQRETATAPVTSTVQFQLRYTVIRTGGKEFSYPRIDVRPGENMFVGILILLVAFFLSEYIVRRCEARRP